MVKTVWDFLLFGCGGADIESTNKSMASVCELDAGIDAGDKA